MATGKCVNIGKPCSKAINKEIQEADSANFVCSECGKPLIPVAGSKDSKEKKHQTDPERPKWQMPAIIAIAILVVAGGGFGIWKAFSNSDPKGADKVEIKEEKDAETKKRNKAIIPGSNLIKEITIADGKDFNLKRGTSKQLQYQANPAQNSETPEWKSSDPSIVIVDANGNVTAVNKGKAEIFVKAREVSSAPITVTVTEEATTVPPVNPPYGKFTGERNAQGLPHGFGDFVFTKSKLVTGNTYAEPGYKIRNARYVNGKLQSGTLYDADGIKICFIDANNNL